MSSISRIPVWTPEGHLPPFTGDNAAGPAGRSPYSTTILDVVTTYGTTLERVQLLSGLIAYRGALSNVGLRGFQWINGSFTEDVERVRLRPPGDIDVVTFIEYGTTPPQKDDLHRLFLDRESVRGKYGVDTYGVELNLRSDLLVQVANYWYGLWSHTKAGHSWKGFLQVPLDYADDKAALGWVNKRLTEFSGEADRA